VDTDRGSPQTAGAIAMNPGIAASLGGEVRVAWQDSRSGPFRNTFVRASHDGDDWAERSTSRM
jgi:hypothetical protein